MKGQDYQAYLQYYKQLIQPVSKEYCESGELICIDNARDEIWKAYVDFNGYCKKHYMTHPENLLDRHKVCACYICAILKADTLKNIELIKLSKGETDLANEKLALCVGLSMLRAMILNEAYQLPDDPKECPERKKLIDSFLIGAGEFIFPETNHGTFKNNLLAQLYHTKKESLYNILAIAETMYCIECIHLLKNGIPENIFSIYLND